MQLRPLVERRRSTGTDCNDAAHGALVDPAWRSQLIIGITVLNWLHQDKSDREDLTELANELATPGQRRLLLPQRWVERDLAALARPNFYPEANLRGPLAYRADHAGVHRRRTHRGASRREDWDLNIPTTAPQLPRLR